MIELFEYWDTLNSMTYNGKKHPDELDANTYKEMGR